MYACMYMYRGKKNHLSGCLGQVEFQARQAYLFTQYPGEVKNSLQVYFSLNKCDSG